MGWGWFAPQDKLSSVVWCAGSWKEAYKFQPCKLYLALWFLLPFGLLLWCSSNFAFFSFLSSVLRFCLPVLAFFSSSSYSIPSSLPFYFPSRLSPFLFFLILFSFFTLLGLLLHGLSPSFSSPPLNLPLTFPPLPTFPLCLLFFLFHLCLSLFLGVSLCCLSRDIVSDKSHINPKLKTFLGIWI